MIFRTHRNLPILAVSSDIKLLGSARHALAPDVVVECCADATVARALLETRPFAGAILDSALPARAAMSLARCFLAHQPTGHVAILSCDDDPTTMAGLSLRDRRVDILFQPLDVGCLRRHFLGDMVLLHA